jgi:hypothetical protein
MMVRARVWGSVSRVMGSLSGLRVWDLGFRV